MGIRPLIDTAKAFGGEKAVSCLPYCRAIVFLSGKRVNAKTHDFDNLLTGPRLLTLIWIRPFRIIGGLVYL
jgi:hypothetical protein